jgi:hypothetical protein
MLRRYVCSEHAFGLLEPCRFRPLAMHLLMWSSLLLQLQPVWMIDDGSPPLAPSFFFFLQQLASKALFEAP